MFNGIELIATKTGLMYASNTSQIVFMKPESFDEIVAYCCSNLPPNEMLRIQEQLKDPGSDWSKAMDAMRQIVRTEIDLKAIPGLEEIAAHEDRLATIQASIDKEEQQVDCNRPL